MNTNTTTNNHLAVVWPTATFWPPNHSAATLALGAMEYLQSNPDAASIPPGAQAIATIKAFLLLAYASAPRPSPELPIDE